MPVWLQTAISIIVAAFASTGLWSFIQKKTEAKDARSRMLLGLGHDRIVSLCSKYIQRGFIQKSEYENLYKYLYQPYLEMGGNGLVKKMMAAIDKLPIKEDSFDE